MEINIDLGSDYDLIKYYKSGGLYKKIVIKAFEAGYSKCQEDIYVEAQEVKIDESAKGTVN